MRTLAFVLGFVAVIAVACGPSGRSGGAPTPTPTPQLRTWYEDVAPIVMANCAGCHQPGGIAPFSLLTYADAVPQAAAMKSATASRTMPPETVDVSGACNTYRNARYLDATQIQTIADWADGGTKQGNPANAPPTPTPVPTLANVSATIDIGASYTPPASPSDMYRCFIADPGAGASTFMTGFEVVPGNPKIVHHVVVYTLDSAQAETDAATLDANDPGLGYTCFGGSNVSASRLLLAWAPGEGATTFASGTGIQLAQGRKVVIQVHYNVLQGTGADQTAVKLQTASSVTKPAIMTFIADTSFSLPPGQTDVSATKDIPIPSTGLLYSVFPHMHKLGTHMKLELVHNGTPTCVTDVPRWNFNWQEFHDFTAPITGQAGDSLRITCHWNTTSATGTTTFGENTTDEMCVFGLYATGP